MIGDYMEEGSVSYLGSLGLQLDTNGYQFFPGALRSKKPVAGAVGWPGKARDAGYRKMVCEKLPDSNICIPTGNGLAAADFDVLDLDLTRALLQSFMKWFGSTPVRVGHSPKCLCPFRVSERMSKGVLRFTQDTGEGKPTEHKIEFLGEGQYFVAYGIHPSNAEYRWLGKQCLLDIPRGELPLIELDDLNDWIQQL